jgi:hypothetical protein
MPILALDLVDMGNALQDLFASKQLTLPDWFPQAPGGPSVGTTATPIYASHVLNVRNWVNEGEGVDYPTSIQYGVNAQSYYPTVTNQPLVDQPWINRVQAALPQSIAPDPALLPSAVRCQLITTNANGGLTSQEQSGLPPRSTCTPANRRPLSRTSSSGNRLSTWWIARERRNLGPSGTVDQHVYYSPPTPPRWPRSSQTQPTAA